MTLAEMIRRARDFLQEQVTSIEAENVAEDFEGYTAGSAPTTPWVSTGTQPPRVESVVGRKMLKVQASGASGKVGINISTQIASVSNPVHVVFYLYRTATASAVVNLVGINESQALNSVAALQLLRLSAAGVFECNTSGGWVNLIKVLPVAATCKVELLLYENRYDVLADGALLATGKYYPAQFSGSTLGYLWLPANNHATADCYINDLTSTGAPTVQGETQWTDDELGQYANEGVAFFRQILPARAFHRQMTTAGQDLASGITSYALPAGFQRFLGATVNGKPLNLVDIEDSVRIRHYLADHPMASGMAAYPTGWLAGGCLNIYPAPASPAADGLMIYYLGAISEMDTRTPSSATPELPEDLHYLLVHYVCMKAREKFHEDTSAVRADMEAMAMAASARYSVAKAGAGVQATPAQ